jgi:hypothetical protein
MASIVYKSLSSLSPIELVYQYYKDEELKSSVKTYRDGQSFYKIEGFNNFQDITINRNSLFVLTSAVNLTQIFQSSQDISLGKLPGSVQLRPRFDSINYIKHNLVNNTFKKTLNFASTFYIQPVVNSNEVELLVNNKFVQVEPEYPYTVVLGDRTLDIESINRQRFEVLYQDNLIAFRTLTNSGYRYLAFNNDNVLRAVGVILSNSVINDFLFQCFPVSVTTINQGFTPSNNWVTYYFEVENKNKNKSVTLNKVLAPTQTHLLIDLPIERAAAEGSVNINIANLKTELTPSGGPAPISNTYEKQVITSN